MENKAFNKYIPHYVGKHDQDAGKTESLVPGTHVFYKKPVNSTQTPDGNWELFWIDSNGNDCCERGTLEYIASEYVRFSLIFRYALVDSCGDIESVGHAHSFDDVLRVAMENVGFFSIPDKYLSDYSAQELELLERFSMKLMDDINSD